MRFSMKNKKGLTLIELITVIAILAVLMTVLLAIIDPVAQIQKSRDARRKSDLSQIQKAIEQYYNDNRKYPDSTGSTPPSQCLPSQTYEIEFGNGNNQCLAVDWGKNGFSPYISILPIDPRAASGTKYVYVTANNGQTYYLYASLERASTDASACNAGAACLGLSGLGVSNTACGSTCNYGVTSPNVSP